jgi:hypothetical protein
MKQVVADPLFRRHYVERNHFPRGDHRSKRVATLAELRIRILFLMSEKTARGDAVSGDGSLGVAKCNRLAGETEE